MEKKTFDTIQDFMFQLGQSSREISDASLNAELTIAALIAKDMIGSDAVRAVITLNVDGSEEYVFEGDITKGLFVDLADFGMGAASNRAALSSWTIQQFRHAVQEFFESTDYTSEFEPMVQAMHPRAMMTGLVAEFGMKLEGEMGSSISFNAGLQVHADTEAEDREFCRKHDMEFVPKNASDFPQHLVSLTATGFRTL